MVDNWEEKVDVMSESGTYWSYKSKTDIINEVLTVTILGKNPTSAFEEVKRRASSTDVDAKNAIN